MPANDSTTTASLSRIGRATSRISSGSVAKPGSGRAILYTLDPRTGTSTADSKEAMVYNLLPPIPSGSDLIVTPIDGAWFVTRASCPGE